MNYTSNYKLNLPEGRDTVEIGKLNDNFTKLDSTVKSVDNRVTTVNNSLNTAKTTLQNNIDSAKSTLQGNIDSVENTLQGSINSVSDDRKPVTGTYTGNSNSSRKIELGFQPSVVFVLCRNTGYYTNSSSMALPESTGYCEDGTLLAVTETGFTVYCSLGDRHTNYPNWVYQYVAWR